LSVMSRHNRFMVAVRKAHLRITLGLLSSTRRLWGATGRIYSAVVCCLGGPTLSS
jgi:hypothetical protein